MTNIFTDSIFSVDLVHRMEKIQIAKILKQSFDKEIAAAIKLLIEYESLVEHDDF